MATEPPSPPAEAEAPAGGSALEARLGPGFGSLRARTARGTLVNAAFDVGLATLGIVRGFVVAAFLTRSEYAIWGILLVSLGTIAGLRAVGVSDKYIQQDEPDQQLAYQRAFTLEVIFSGLTLAVLLACVPLIALLYRTPELTAPGFALSLLIVPTVLQWPLWHFYRRLRFARQRAIAAIDPIVAFVVTVGLAAAGASYWSLVAGTLAGATASAVAAQLFAPYPLALRYDRGIAREYVRFSVPLLIATISSIVVAQGSLLAGERVVGLAGVGAMSLAIAVSMFARRVDEIVTVTIYPAICAVRDRTELLAESFVKTNRIALLWGAPFGFGLTLFAPDLVNLGLGERWEAAIPLLQVFGAIAAIDQIGFNWTAFYRARGETRPIAVVLVLMALAFLAIALPALIAGGLEGFAAGMAGVTLVGLLARAFYVRRLFPALNLAAHAARGLAPVVPAIAVTLGARAALSLDRTLGVAIGELVLFIAVAVAVTLALERPLLRELAAYLRRRERDPAAAPAGR